MKREILSFYSLTEEELRQLCPAPSAMEQGFYRMKFDRQPRPEPAAEPKPSAKPEPSAMEQGFYRMKFDRQSKPEPAAEPQPSAKPEPSAMEQGFYRMKFDRQPKSEPAAEPKPSAKPESPVFPEPKVGDVIPFGGFQWCVVERNGDVMRILAKEPVAQRPYDHVRFGNVEWRSSALRDWLNGEFFASFTKAQQAAVLTSRMLWTKGLLRKQQEESLDRVCLLTAAEAQRLLDCGQLPPCEGWWWLIDANQSNVSVVDQKNRLRKFSNMSYRKKGGVRPVLYLSLTAYQRLRKEGGC